MMTTIRPANRADWAAILDIVVDQLDAPTEASLTTETAPTVFDSIHQNPHHHLFVAEANGKMVGVFALIVVQQIAHDGGKSAVVEDVAVKSSAQGQGVGRQMMTFATDFARDQGCYKIVLSSNKARTLAHDFYHRLGYQQHGISFSLDLGGKRPG